ncbi:chorismate-binding protein [Buchnera aphidicola]|uniref:chorismate-binding protein n=1 Tax=Buchnera aphidicola TaxID=9 RepID=UPI0031B73DDA
MLLFKKFKKKKYETENFKSSSIFDSFRLLINSISSSENISSMLFGGFFSYDLIYNFEKLPYVKKKNNCLDFCFYLAESFLIINHKKKISTLQTNVFTKNFLELKRLKKRFQEIKKILKKKIMSLKIITTSTHKIFKIFKNFKKKKFIKNIKILKSLIYCNEIFQIRISYKFFIPCEHPLNAYQNLKKKNPYTCTFYMKDQNFILFGYSLENYLKYSSQKNLLQIFSSTGMEFRQKNKNNIFNQNFDIQTELFLRTNQKKLSEHIMLIDLIKNDLSKICKTNSQKISQLMKIKKCSNTIYFLSKIIGKLKNNLDIFHFFQAFLNAGIVTGIPKINAMKIIAQIEKINRGHYGGSIGYFLGFKKTEMYTILDAAYIENNIATIQSGIQIFLDSCPYQENFKCFEIAQMILLTILESNNFSNIFYV